MNTDPVSPARALFEAQLPTIESMIISISRRRRLETSSAEDFYSYSMIKLLESDCACLGKFRGDSSPKTFLNIVLQRLYLDFQDHRLGRWRPCALARREGPQAAELDRLLTREGHTVEEALQILSATDQDRFCEGKLRGLAARLPGRRWRKRREVQVLDDYPSSDRADSDILKAERRQRLLVVYEELKEAINRFEAEDRRILRLRFVEGLQVAQIARNIQVEAKPLYRRFYRLLRSLRKALESRGVGKKEVEGLLS